MDKIRTEIILIGPQMAGKSTVGKLLAKKLSLPQISLDKLRWEYYRQIGFNDDLAQELKQKGGFLAVVAYWSLFNSYAIEQIVREYKNCVFDFGAGPVVFENNLLQGQIERALEPFVNLIRLLPSPNLEESIRILNERSKFLKGTNAQGFSWSRYFIEHKANQRLANPMCGF